MISTIKIDELPQSWDDGIDWSVNADVTLRHFLAIIQAIGERKSLSLGYTCPYLNDVINAYSSKTHTGLEWICNKLYSEISDMLIGDPFSRFDRSMRGSLGDGCVCQNFASPFQPNTNLRERPFWYPPNYEIPEDPITHRIPNVVWFPNTMIQLSKEYLATIPCMPKVNRYSNIKKSYKEIIKWLSELKRATSLLNRIVSKDIMTAGGTYARGYHLYTVNGEEKEEIYETDTYDFGRRFEEMWNPSGTDYNVSCFYESNPRWGTVNPKDDYSYTNGNGFCPTKFINLLDFSVEVFVHVSAEAVKRDVETGEEEYIDDTEFFGLPVSQRGWNSLGEVSPGQSVVIVPDSFANKDYFTQKFKAWHSYEAKYYTEWYATTIDAIMLYFYTNDNNGFRF